MSNKPSKKNQILNSEHFIKALYGSGMVCIGILFYFILKNLSNIGGFFATFLSVLMPFIFGFALAYLLSPILKFLEKYLGKLIGNKKILRAISTTMTLLFAVIVLWAIVGIISPKLMESLNDLFVILLSSVNKFSTWALNFINNSSLDDYLTKEQINEITGFAGTVITKLYDFVQKIIPQLISITGSVTKTLINIVLGIIVSIYILLSKEKFSAQIKKILYAVFKKERVISILKFSDLTNKIFSKYIVGQLLDAVIVGILCFVIMTILSIPYALLISVIICVTNVIPYFGPFLGAIPSGLILLAIDVKYALIFLVVILVIQQIDGNIIAPKILGDSTGLSGFWILFAVTVGGDLFGIMGMVLGVPVFAIFYTCFVFITNKRLGKKGMSENTLNYYNENDDEEKSN